MGKSLKLTFLSELREVAGCKKIVQQYVTRYGKKSFQPEHHRLLVYYLPKNDLFVEIELPTHIRKELHNDEQSIVQAVQKDHPSGSRQPNEP